MNFLSRNKTTAGTDNDQLARRIAGLLLAAQTRLAIKLNSWINKRPKVVQKRMLWFFSALFALALAASSGDIFHGIAPGRRQRYRPSSIGQPSAGTTPGRRQAKPGDSLILKK